MPRFRLGLAAMLMTTLLPAAAAAQWSAEPGQTARNLFGPERADGKPSKVCRGACGSGCPDSCQESVAYQCLDATRMLKVRVYDCGTNIGCREHDDCLDRCTSNPATGDCDTVCHQEAVENYGMERSMSWLGGGDPYDGRITFEYTREQPGSAEGVYRCPSGSRLECGGGAGRCIGAGDKQVDPVFDGYSGTGPGMRISNFETGRLCGESVCKQAKVIEVSGQDSCDGGACTRFGMAFDYTGADPSEPLTCRTPIVDEGEKDFVEKMFRPMVESGNVGAAGGGEGMNELFGLINQVVKAVESGEQVSYAPLGEDGKPIESERVQLQAAGTEGSSIPHTIDVPAESGHLVVPMHQMVGGAQTEPVTREIYCTHEGVPVLETSFVLQF